MGDFLESIEIQMIYTGIARWVLVALAVYILVRCVVSLVRVSSPAEVWAYLHISRYGLDADGDVELLDERSEPITHWENVIGRAASCDIQVADEAISRNHGVLTRGTDGTWAYRDLGSKNGSYLEEVRISKEGEMGPPITMAYGDVLRTGLTEFTLLPISLEEQNNNLAMRKSDTKMMSIGPTMAALTLFQILTMLQLWLALGTAPVNAESGGRGELRAGQTVQAVFGCGDRSGGAAFDVRAAAKSGKLQALAVAAARGRGAAFGCKFGAGHVWLRREKLAGNRACQLPAVGAGQGGVYLDRGGVTGRII